MKLIMLLALQRLGGGDGNQQHVYSLTLLNIVTVEKNVVPGNAATSPRSICRKSRSEWVSEVLDNDFATDYSDGSDAASCLLSSSEWRGEHEAADVTCAAMAGGRVSGVNNTSIC